jgi:transcriptional regulator with GAF, ATPase, and Fis domain
MSPNSSAAKIIRNEDLERLGRESIVAGLDRSSRRISGVSGAAELLDVDPNTLASRIRSLGIKRERLD